ncbi:hypothetical protein C8R45DRAFT_1077375 [Mycena sanguinolenta]|nr:hypothetical protein C8R45DRAFT_1077375 [Mycena sanguinolenta]
MPIYEVWHSYPFTEAQRHDLAQRITTIHTTMLTVPRPSCMSEYYIGGKKRTGNVNLILANVRTGPSRAHALFESLCRQIEAAWTATVVDLATQDGAHAHLAGAFVLDTVTAAYEQGFMFPEAGHDVEWMCENLPKFQALADGGNELFRDMIGELRTREDFNFVFESA